MEWPTRCDEALRSGIHRLLHDVVAIGGAVGWLVPPTRAESDAWLLPVMAEVQAGNAALCVIPSPSASLTTGGTTAPLATTDTTAPPADTTTPPLLAMGCWRRIEGPIFAHSALITKMMTHPLARQAGHARTVLTALIEHARTAGLETLQLGVRGNNHGAIALYQSLGFDIWGRLPNVIEVGNLRFDDVRMYRRLERSSHLQLMGSEPVGPGSSRRPSSASLDQAAAVAVAATAQPSAPIGHDTPVPPSPQ